jgi:hypothetical protein
MAKNLLATTIFVILAIALVSCDVLGTMESMGENIVGVDTAQVATAVSSVTVKEENRTTIETSDKTTIDGREVNNASTFKYTNAAGQSQELYTVGTTTAEDGSEKNVIGLGGTIIELPSDSTIKLDEIKAVLPPQDLSAVSNKLTGSNKEEMLKQLETPVTDETTKEAAQGTKAVVQVLLESADNMIAEDEASKELVEKILDNMNAEDSEMTMGDVVVLQALTNLICETPATIAELAKEDTKTSEASGNSATQLLEEANDTIMATAEILNTVSASTTLFEGVDLTVLMNTFMSTK